MSKPRLAVDNVHALPSTFIPHISAALRAYAELIEDGEVSANRVILVTQDDDGMIDFAAIGEPCDSAQAVGYLEMAKAKMIEGSWRE
jgi:hypothetical protein